MEGKKFLGMDREMRTALGVSYVTLLAMLIAVFAMFNSKLTQNEAALDANLKASVKASKANWAAHEANLKAIAAQTAANSAALEELAAEMEARSANIEYLTSMTPELLKELAATGCDDVEPKVGTDGAR